MQIHTGVGYPFSIKSYTIVPELFIGLRMLVSAKAKNISGSGNAVPISRSDQNPFSFYTGISLTSNYSFSDKISVFIAPRLIFYSKKIDHLKTYNTTSYALNFGFSFQFRK